MATETIQLSSNIGTGDLLSVDTLAGGEKVQNIKILSAADASETEIHAGHGLAANALRVELPTDGTGVVGLNSGVNSIGTCGLNSGSNSVGTFGIDAGSAEIGKVLSEGKVAHDAVGTSINPVLGGAIAYATDGTAPGTAVAEGDITRLKADRDGRQFVNTGHPASASASDTTSSARTAQVLVSAPAAGFSVYITDIQMSAITAQTAWLHDSDDTVVFPLQYFGANTGSVSVNFKTPIKLVAAKALEVTSTAAVAHSTLVNYYVAP